MTQSNRLSSNDVVEVINSQGKRLLCGFIIERDANLTTLRRVAPAIASPFWHFDTVEMPSNGYIFQRVADLSGENGLLLYEIARYIEAASESDCFEMRIIIDFTGRIVLGDLERFYALWARYPDGESEPHITRHKRMRDTIIDGMQRLLAEPSASEESIRRAIVGFPLGWTKRSSLGVLEKLSERPRRALVGRILSGVPKKAKIEECQYYHSYIAD